MITGEFGKLTGRAIEGVIIKERKEGDPKWQIFLVFDDGHYFEIYGGDGFVRGAKGLDEGWPEDVRKYMSTEGKITFDSCSDLENDNPLELLQRERVKMQLIRLRFHKAKTRIRDIREMIDRKAEDGTLLPADDFQRWLEDENDTSG